MTRRLLLLLTLAVPVAWARQPDGTLGLMCTPNNGVPVVVGTGGVFEAVLVKRAILRIADSESTIDLAAEWTVLPDGRWKARCTVPAAAQPGTYTLEAVAGDEVDRNVRSVYVRQAFPEYYVVAHIAETCVGSDGDAHASEAMFADLVQAVDTSPAVLVIITGDLTHDGSAEAFRRFMTILDRCGLPTFVCPGERDGQHGHYDRFFGPSTHMFWFGHDGYLLYSTGHSVMAADAGNQDAVLRRFRRAIKPARWSIGFTDRYDLRQGMRSQIVLFIDDPLDHLFLSHWHREDREEEGKVPWGTTPITLTPHAREGVIRLIDVSPRAVRPREAEHVVTVD